MMPLTAPGNVPGREVADGHAHDIQTTRPGMTVARVALVMVKQVRPSDRQRISPQSPSP